MNLMRSLHLLIKISRCSIRAGTCERPTEGWVRRPPALHRALCRLTTLKVVDHRLLTALGRTGVTRSRFPLVRESYVKSQIGAAVFSESDGAPEAGSCSTVACCPGSKWVRRTTSPSGNSSASWCVMGLSRLICRKRATV
jgi:hypothetical protein